MGQFSLLQALWLASVLVSFGWAADCGTNQSRKEGDPSGEQIAAALTTNNQIDSVCAGNWRVGDDERVENTFNHGSMIYEVQRSSKDNPLQYCKEAFGNIIDQCISGDNYWGGSWSYGGETYNISNTIYPENPLLSTDDGGPSEVPSPTPSTTAAATSITVSTADTGLITPGPQTSTESGTFETSTQSIDGLTANSATTTTVDDHATILPIWYVGPGVGIIVIPAAGVLGGGIVPPPAGYPPLTIGADGNPSSVTPQDNDPSTTENSDSSSSSESSSSSTSSSSCTSCATCALVDPSDDIVVPTDVAEIDPDFPFIIPGGETPSGTTSASSTSSSAAATQPADPIDKPKCSKNDASAPPRSVQASDGDVSMSDLLYRIRQQICTGSCSPPEGIIEDVTNITSSDDGARCEISVRVSEHTEAYMYRNSKPEGDEWQQCWDSTEQIINNCVNKKTDEGWWNGNHVYQFYQGGLRTWYGAPTPWWLPPKGISHPYSELCLYKYPICTGYEGTADSNAWKRRSSLLTSRAEDEKESCGITYSYPGWPSSGTAQNINGVTKWIDMLDITAQGGVCNYRLNQFDNMVNGHSYATEHIWEKHFVKTFLNWLSFDGSNKHGAVIDCAGKKAVFDTPSDTPDSPFRYTTPARALANTITCYQGGCPNDKRVNEFFILESGINGMKTKVLGRLSKNENPMMPSNAKQWREMKAKMVELSMVFKYMQDPAVYNIFNIVNERFRSVLKAIDDDDSYTVVPQPQAIGTNPETYISHDSWRNAFDYWLSDHLHNAQIKSDEWMHDIAMVRYPKAVNADTSLSQVEKDREIAWAAAHRNSGLFTGASMSFGDLYAGMMGTNWVTRP